VAGSESSRQMVAGMVMGPTVQAWVGYVVVVTVLLMLESVTGHWI
jgi:hypothetical protein